jgi:Tat protein translocase TatB subunit
MNIFSNIGITELIIILLLAVIVVGPERLPELGRKLGQILRDVRKAYENLTRDLGPEFTSIQQTTQEIRESFDSVRSIPQDMVQSVTKAAELDETIGELKEVQESIGQVGATLTSAGKMVKDPVGAAVNTARETLMPKESVAKEEPQEETQLEGEEAPLEEETSETESLGAGEELTPELAEEVVEELENAPSETGEADTDALPEEPIDG